MISKNVDKLDKLYYKENIIKIEPLVACRMVVRMETSVTIHWFKDSSNGFETAKKEQTSDI